MHASPHAEDVTWSPSRGGGLPIPNSIASTNERPTRGLERNTEQRYQNYTEQKLLKGRLGEQTYIRVLNSTIGCGYVYQGDKKDHKIDFVVTHPTKGKYLADVKTSQQRREFDDYGFNLYTYVIYKELQVQYEMPVMLIFVDYLKGIAVGNYLDILDQYNEFIDSKGRALIYPWVVTYAMSNGDPRPMINFPTKFFDKQYDLLPEEIQGIENASSNDNRD